MSHIVSTALFFKKSLIVYPSILSLSSTIFYKSAVKSFTFLSDAANAVKESLFSPKILFSLFNAILSIKDLPDPGPPKIEIVLGIKLLLFR